MKLKKIFESIFSPEPVSPDKKVQQWLIEKGLNPKLVHELSQCSFSGPIWVNNICFECFNELVTTNLDECNEKCIQNGYLIIGNGLNGDPIVLSIKDSNVGFVFHDELWEDENCSFADIIAMTQLDVYDFFSQARSDEFPVDGYECEEKGLNS